jgi:hypothetical protein
MGEMPNGEEGGDDGSAPLPSPSLPSVRALPSLPTFAAPRVGAVVEEVLPLPPVAAPLYGGSVVVEEVLPTASSWIAPPKDDVMHPRSEVPSLGQKCPYLRCRWSSRSAVACVSR